MIKVADVIMGGGKSSAAIQYMNDHPNELYLYIAPYNAETERIKAACPDLNFVLPHIGIERYSFTKSGHLKSLIERGKNVALTHSLLSLAPRSVCEEISAQGYTVFIDEAVDMYEPFVIKRDDLQIVLDSGWLTRKYSENGAYLYYEENPNKQYEGEKYRDLFTYVHSKRIVVGDRDDIWGDQLYWVYNDALFKGNANIYVLTYLFEGSTMSAFFKMNDIPYETIGVRKSPDGKYYFCDTPTMPSYAKYIKDKVHILDNAKMNRIGNRENAFSATWSKNAFKNSGGLTERLKSDLSNFFNNMHRDIPYEQRLWCSFAGDKNCIRDKLAGAGYKNRFLSFNCRATNDYKECRALAYCVNVYLHGGVNSYIQSKGVTIDEDLYALSSMVQWVWRSAIRAGGEIYLYVPSRRMRTLFAEWLDRIAEEAEDDI